MKKIRLRAWYEYAAIKKGPLLYVNCRWSLLRYQRVIPKWRIRDEVSITHVLPREKLGDECEAATITPRKYA